MTQANLKGYRLGWVGTGRMGYAMALRLLKSGCDVAVYNRTRAKAEPLTEFGATIVDSPADLAHRDIVFTMVSGPDDLIEVTPGARASYRARIMYRRFWSIARVSRLRRRLRFASKQRRGASRCWQRRYPAMPRW